MTKKKLNYQQRWRLKHRPVTIYLSSEEYEALQQLADRSKLSYRELLYGAAKDVRKLYEELVRKYVSGYANEIVRVKQDYEARIAKLKQEYEAKLREEYNRGFNDGKKKMRDFIYGRCEVRCRQ